MNSETETFLAFLASVEQGRPDLVFFDAAAYREILLAALDESEINAEEIHNVSINRIREKHPTGATVTAALKIVERRMQIQAA